MRSAAVVAAAVLVVLAALPARAQDKTLSEGHPVRLGDAFPVATGEGAVLLATGTEVPRHRHVRGLFPIEIQYGALPRTQLSLSSRLSSHPHETDDPRAGDLALNIRTNFGEQSASLPSMAGLLGVTLPTGVDSTAYAVTVKGYATRTIAQQLDVHLNIEEDVSDRAARGERQARYGLALGASYVIPTFATLMVVGDVFADQAARLRDATTVGAEIGVRYRLSAKVYWDVGAGTEFAGPADRNRFTFTAGVTIGF